MEIINDEKKEIIPLTYDENRYYEKKKYCQISQKKRFGMIKRIKINLIITKK